MSKIFENVLRLSAVIVSILILASRAEAQVETQSADGAKLNSVSQLSDVQPTDWAFQALQSLVERYGCIAGYPNSTYRGNRAMTRYEFAAGLNACLNRVNELIATATTDIVKKEDLTTLQRLQGEFSAELTTLRGRVDTLESRTAELDAQQFSTTTKLTGEAIFALSGVFGNTKAVPSGRTQGSLGDINNNEVFADRIRLSFNTSFTGQDLLRVRLQARNITPFNTGVTGTNMTRLGFDGDEGNNGIFLDELFYKFPLGKQAFIQIDATNDELVDRGFNLYSPGASSGTGAISRYGRFSPIYRVANYNLGTAPSAGISFHYNPKGSVGVELGYFPQTANNPGQGLGIGRGAYAALGQLDLKFSKSFSLGLTYAHTYDNPERRSIALFDSTGGVLANAPFGNIPTTGNHYGAELSFQPSSKLTIVGWGGYTQAIAELSPTTSPAGALNGATRLTGSRGSKADIFYYAAGVAFPDFGKKGSLLSFIVGQSPRLIDNDAQEVLANGRIRRRRDSDTAYSLEGYYRYALTNNIDLTPSVLVILNPEHNNDNSTEYIGTLRTTFTF
ncbi:MAG: iron uptake porin [Rhizonema sp. PD38]|nr:iron uptake porin [Rhizonema sp. PD38]